MSTEVWSYVIYGIWFLAWVVLELLGLERARTKVPWWTLSETGWSLERRHSAFKLLFYAGLSILTVHIAFGFPNNPLP